MSATAVRRTRRDPLEVPLKVSFPFWVIGSLLLVLFPIYLIFMVSFAPGSALFGERPALVVTNFTLRWWREAFKAGGLISPLQKSLVVASATTLLAIAIAAPAAYVISRLLETIPIDLEEAAQIDGASRLGTLIRVVFPVAAGGIAVASLFVWLYSWNEFLYARLLTTNQLTLPLKVFQAIDRGTKQEMATIAAILTLPILLVVYFLQRYLRPGALTGAVKG